MAKAGFYAVAKGRVPGIYASWEDCEEQVKGYTGAKYKKFKTLREAEAFVGVSSSTPTSALVPRSSSRTRLAISKSGTRPQASGKMSKPNVSTDDRISEEGYDVVYADGACKGNGQAGSVAGVGVWWGNNDSRNIAERCPGSQTNNRAELIAIVRVLEQTSSYGRPLMIKTDSTYSIKCLRDWHQSWAHNNWRTSSGKPVLNAPLIRYLLSLLQLRDLQGFPVKFVYVKGHAGIEGNEGADGLANEGCRMAKVLVDRDWNEERRKVEELIEELREGVEVADKVVQVEIQDEDDALASVEEPVPPEVEASEPSAKPSLPSTIDTASVANSTSTAPTSTLAPNPTLAPVSASVPEGEAKKSLVPTTPKPQIEKGDSGSGKRSETFEDDFGIDDLLDLVELEKELAETLKS